ncbi:unnamed protein product [Choristocarpus tenellus]
MLPPLSFPVLDYRHLCGKAFQFSADCLSRMTMRFVFGTRRVIVTARPAAPTCIRFFSDNVTYSGGQAGIQGGFYASGGARSQVSPQAHHRPEAVAALDDIRRLREVMQHVNEMEVELSRLGTEVSGRSIELKSSLKKRLSARSMFDLLERLEINNQPVWGLTQEERALVATARQKVNSC